MKKRKIIKPDPTLRNNLMAFGYECDKGWYPLIEECLDRIEKALEKHPDNEYGNFMIMQVKEKFGGLRIYANFYYEDVRDIIEECEEKSYHVCEVCGEPGKLRVYHYWYKTLCNKHFSEWINPYRYYR